MSARPAHSSSAPQPAAGPRNPRNATPVAAWFERRLGFLNIGRVMAALIVLTPILALYSRRQIVALLVVGAVTILFAGRFGNRPVRLEWLRIDGRVVAAGLLFLAWGALSLTWTIDLGRSAGVAASAAGIGLAGFVLVIFARLTDAADRAMVGKACLAAAVIGMALIAFEAAIGLAGIKWLWPLLGQTAPKYLGYLNFPLLVLTPLAPLAAVYALHRGWWWAALLLYAAALGLASQLESGTALLALVAGGVAILVFGALPRRLRLPAVLAAAAVGMLLVPVLGKPMSTSEPVLRVFGWVGDSARHRLAIWGELGGFIAERPVQGVGMGAVRSIPAGKRMLHVKKTAQGGAMNVELIPMHPHNSGLEIGIELGIPGMILAYLFLAALIAAGFRMASGRWTQAGVAALACSATVSGMMGLSVWNYSFDSAYLIAIAAFAAWLPKPSSESG